MAEHYSSNGSAPPSEAAPGNTWRADFLASLVVFLVALPLCMGIAIASNVPVSAGLVTGIVGGLVVATISGSPLQVSGPAAGLTVIVYEAVQRHGIEMLGLVVLIAGIFQLLAASARLGQWFRAVSPAVISGMLAGIGVLIFASQFHVMLDDRPHGGGIENLAAIPGTIAKAAQVPEFPERDVRKEKRTTLIALEELHRRQKDLNTRVAGHIPHHRERTRETVIDLQGFVAEQQSIRDDLQTLISGSSVIFAHDPERGQRAEQLGAATMSQLGESLLDLETNRDDLALASQERAVESLRSLEGAYRNHTFGAAIGVLTLIALILWTTFARGKLSIVPAPLIAVVVGTVAAMLLQLPIMYVEIPSSVLDELHIVSSSIISDAPWAGLLVTGFLMAVVASAETLLSANAVDQLQNGPRCKYNRELMSQGVGNVICGCLGALPMTGVIVRSSANVHAGAKTRKSAIMHGLWLLLFVVFLGSFLRMIPTASLAAILVYTGYKLVNIKEIKRLAKFGRGELLVYFATLTVIVVEDLLMGVLVGLCLAIGKLVLQFARVHADVDEQVEDGRAVVRLRGAATFLKVPKLAGVLERVPAKAHVHFDTDMLVFIDPACLDLLVNWARQHEATGGRVDLDIDQLREFARAGRPRLPHFDTGKVRKSHKHQLETVGSNTP